MGTNDNEDELITDLRKRILSRGPELSEFDERDIVHAQHDDNYLALFLNHMKRDVDKALEMMVECFKWRNSFGVNDLLERNIDRRLFELGFLYPRNTDKSNNTLLIFHMKLYKKDVCDLEEVKKLFAFAFEKMSQNSNERKLTMVFDMQETQLANMDLELIKFIINCFQIYFPSLLEYMIVFETPWILTAAWKYVKTYLSSDPSFKIKFVNKTEILQYVETDNLLSQMGGSDAFIYKYPPQLFSGCKSNRNGLSHLKASPKKNDMFSSLSTSTDKAISKLIEEKTKQQNNEISSDSVEHSLTDSFPQNNLGKQENDNLLKRLRRRDYGRRKNQYEKIGPLVTVSPANELTFCGTPSNSCDDLLQVITIQNTVSSLVAFKIKTTSPENFRVRPSSGPIKPGQTVEVHVNLQPGHNANVVKDRFLILSAIVPEQDKDDLTLMWKNIPKSSIMEQRLLCRYDTSNSASVDSDGGSNKSSKIEFSSQELLLGLTKNFKSVELKIDKLQSKATQLENDVKVLFRLLIFLIFLLTLVLIFVIFYTGKQLGLSFT